MHNKRERSIQIDHHTLTKADSPAEVGKKVPAGFLSYQGETGIQGGSGCLAGKTENWIVVSYPP